MRLSGTNKLIAFLRERANHLRKGSKNIHQWVEEYLDRSLVNGQTVSILTQWCLSKGLERRFRQENGFIPTKKERSLWSKDIPIVIDEFHRQGFSVNWYITFNRGFTDSRRLAIGLECLYKEMIAELAEDCVSGGSVMLLDWEEDVLGMRPRPNREILLDPNSFISVDALDREVLWGLEWMANETDLRQSEEEIRSGVVFQIACEAEEGRFLASADSPFGSEFILVPLELPEQYDFFSIFVPDFKKRIAAILPSYPWRLKSVEG